MCEQESVLKPEELNRLEALAKAATPGPWSNQHEYGEFKPASVRYEIGNKYLCEFFRTRKFDDTVDPQPYRNAEYVAALSPDTLLRLIAQARTVPPAAAPPSGVLDSIADLERISRIEGLGGINDFGRGRLAGLKEALASAPVTGDHKKEPT